MTEVLNRGRNCLLVKLLSQKYFNRETFKATMKKFWKPTKSLHFHGMGARLIMVEFEDPSNKKRVIGDGPWNFDKCLILTKEFEGEKQVKNICMEEALFWIQIHDLPLIARNEYVGRCMGVALGRLVEVYVDLGEVE